MVALPGLLDADWVEPPVALLARMRAGADRNGLVKRMHRFIRLVAVLLVPLPAVAQTEGQEGLVLENAHLTVRFGSTVTGPSLRSIERHKSGDMLRFVGPGGFDWPSSIPGSSTT